MTAKRVLVVANAAVADRAGDVLSGMEAAGQRAAEGTVGDEDPLQAIADALAGFPADALILALRTPEVANRRERRLGERVRARFDLPVTEMQIDRDGVVVAVTGSAQ